MTKNRSDDTNAGNSDLYVAIALKSLLPAFLPSLTSQKARYEA